MKYSDDSGHLKCSFCGKPQEQVRKLVAGPGASAMNALNCALKS